MQKYSRITIGVLLLIACASVAMAGEGRTPIWEPTVIVDPGKYVVTRNISLAAGPAITIAASGVDIDLNGMTIEAGGPPAVIESFGGLEQLSVRNGHVRGGGDGVSLVDVRSAVVEDLHVSAGPGVGIRITGTDVHIRRNKINDRGGSGISVDAGPFPAAAGVIEQNTIHDVADGILIERGDAMTLLHNQVKRTALGFGIRAGFSPGVMLIENTVEEAADTGILIEACNTCKLYDNVVHRNGTAGAGEGIAIVGGSGNCLILENVVAENVGTGIFVEGFGSSVEGNVINFNGGGGLVLGFGSTGNTYGRNTGRFNGPPPNPCLMPSPCPAPDLCDDGGGLPNTSRGDNVFGLPVC